MAATFMMCLINCLNGLFYVQSKYGALIKKKHKHALSNDNAMQRSDEINGPDRLNFAHLRSQGTDSVFHCPFGDKINTRDENGRICITNECGNHPERFLIFSPGRQTPIYGRLASIKTLSLLLCRNFCKFYVN